MDRESLLLVVGQFFGPADAEFQLIVVAPCKQELHQSSLLLFIVIVDASSNRGVIGKLLEVVGT